MVWFSSVGGLGVVYLSWWSWCGLAQLVVLVWFSSVGGLATKNVSGNDM